MGRFKYSMKLMLGAGNLTEVEVYPIHQTNKQNNLLCSECNKSIDFDNKYGIIIKHNGGIYCSAACLSHRWAGYSDYDRNDSVEKSWRNNYFSNVKFDDESESQLAKNI